MSFNIPVFPHSKTGIPKNSNFYCLIALFILFFFYNLTISPTIYWRDSPEFANTSYFFGIAHPAGFPAYSTISKLFTFFPLSNIAMKVNYVSLCFAILTGYIIFFTIIELINICFNRLSNYHAFMSATFAVLILGLASSFWWMAVVTEVYTMNCFFLSLFFMITLKWHKSKEPRFLFLASFVFGFATAVYGANLLFIPPLFIFYFMADREKSLSRLFLASAFILLGYSIHIYLPVRSLSNPPFDWGNPETFKSFISLITDKKDEGAHFNELRDFSLILKSLKGFILMITRETTIIGLFLIVTGSICHFIKDKKSFFLLAAIGFINTLFFMTTLNDIAKNGSLFLSSIIIFSYWIGLGIYFLLVESSGYLMTFQYKKLIVPVVISFIVFSLVKDYPNNDKSSFYLSRDHLKEMYVSMDQNAMIFASRGWFTFRYFKDIENLRPDISVIPISDILQPKMFNKITPERFPMINFPSMESKRENQHEFMQLLISGNVYDRPVYSEIQRSLTIYNYQYLVPENKFLMRVSGQKIEKIPDEILNKFSKELEESMLRELSNESFFLDQEMGIRSNYETFLTNFADYLMVRKRYRRAIPFLKLAASIVNPEYMEVPMMLGICYLNLKDYNEAEKIFKELFQKNKMDYQNNFNLASLYYKKEDWNEALDYLENAIKLNKDFIESYFLLGLIRFEEGKYGESIKNINYAIEKTRFRPHIERMRKTLDMIKEKQNEKRIGPFSNLIPHSRFNSPRLALVPIRYRTLPRIFKEDSN